LRKCGGTVQCVRKVSDGFRKCQEVVRWLRNCVGKLLDGVRRVSYGVRKVQMVSRSFNMVSGKCQEVSDGARKVTDGVILSQCHIIEVVRPHLTSSYSSCKLIVVIINIK